MKPLQLPLLADENIHPRVVQALREQGKDIVTVGDLDLAGHPDAEILSRAQALTRVVLTHDADFGQLAVRAGQGHSGIIYLRPGHIDPAVVLRSIQAIEESTPSVQPPFILVAERRGDTVRLRLRTSAAAH